MGDIKFKASKHSSPQLHQGNLSSQNPAHTLDNSFSMTLLLVTLAWWVPFSGLLPLALLVCCCHHANW